MMKYSFNLIGDISRARRMAEIRRLRLVTLTAFSFGLLGIALFYAILQIATMQASLREEKTRIVRLNTEYQRYKASKMIVNKADVELLDKLQNSRIFWTKKLVSIANYLPRNYWITKLTYDTKALTVDGYGDLDTRQQQLVTLDDYLNALRDDPMFYDVFNSVFLNSTIRNNDEQKRTAISFSYSAVKRKEP